MIDKAVIIPGAQKSGTSSLYEALCKSDSVVKPEYKETQFFAMKEEKIKNNINWYKKKYRSKRAKRCNSYIIDASTFYLDSYKTPEKIRKYIKCPKVLVVIRNPVARAYSGYQQMKSKTPTPEGRNFLKISKDIEEKCGNANPSIGQLVKCEKKVLNKSIKKVDINYVNEEYPSDVKKSYTAEYEDPLWIYKYYKASTYSTSLSRYVDVLNEDNVNVILFEQLINEPKKVLKSIENFLGMKMENHNLPTKNKTKVPRNWISRQIAVAKRERNSGLDSFWNILKKYAGERLPKEIKEKFFKKRGNITGKRKKVAERLLKSEYEYWFSRAKKYRRYWRQNRYDNK